MNNDELVERMVNIPTNHLTVNQGLMLNGLVGVLTGLVMSAKYSDNKINAEHIVEALERVTEYSKLPA